MEWLKKLIENAKKNEDGSIDMDDLMKQINTEFPKNAVPKADFNEAKEQLKPANGTIETLKKNNGDNETLQNTIKEHEKTIKKLQCVWFPKNKSCIVPMDSRYPMCIQLLRNLINSTRFVAVSLRQNKIHSFLYPFSFVIIMNS